MKDTLYKLKRLLQNIWFFRKELQEYEPFDYHGMLLFNKRCLKGMYDYQQNVDFLVSVNRDNYCLHMKRTIGRLDRLIKDAYNIQNLSHFSEYSFEPVKQCDLPSLKGVRKHSESNRQEDLKAIGKFWERHLLHCWH